MLKQCAKFALVLLAAFVFASASFAQTTRGELAGNVTDSSGAIVPGAKVSATNTATGGKNDTVTTSAGTYRFTALPIGTYTVAVTAPGFSVSSNTGVNVGVGATASLNVTLAPGSATESVTVDASGSRIETESADIGGTISAKEIIELPLSIGGGVGSLRSPENFVFLVPGTTGPGSAGGNQQNSLQANGVFEGKLAGGQDYGAEVLLDGASIQRSENGSSFDETAPSVEALQEFKVTTSTPPAQYGRTTGGIENFATKSGTNAFHGTAFDLFKNDDMDANDWFNDGYQAECAAGDAACRQQFARGNDKKNDYGGSLGGPVRIPKIYNGRDRSFFFFSWEQFRQTLSAAPLSTVPTAAERGGDFSAALGGPTTDTNPCTGQPVLQNQIFDPATTSTAKTANNPNGIPCRLPFAGNIVPTSRFSAAAQSLVKTLPLPNSPGTTVKTQTGFYNNYIQRSTYPVLNTTTTIRIDQTLSDKDKIFVSYSSRDNNRSGANNLPLPYSNLVPQDFFTHYTRVGWDSTITPNLLNHLNLGYNRTNSKNFAQTLGGTNYAATAGIGNVVTTAFPVVNFDGLDSFSGYGTGSNGDNVDNGTRVNDSISLQKGRNSIQFGIDFRYQQYSTLQQPIPTFNFERSETDTGRLANGPTQRSGNSFASFLLGSVDNANQTAYIHSPRWNSHYIAGFFEDNLKATQNLTLNLGIRYEVDSPRHEAEDDTSNFSLTAPDPNANNLPGALVFGKTCHCNTAWADTYFKDIAPRLGFAYLLPGTEGKSVLRGGAAMIYGPLQYVDFGGSMTTGYSVPVSAGVGDGFTPAFSLDSGFPKAFPTAPNLNPGQLDTGGFVPIGGEYISPKMGRPSVTYNFSLQLQQQVAKDLLFTIGYIGQEAQNLRSSLENINNIPLSDLSLGNHLDQDYPTAAKPVDGVSAPYPTFNGQLYRALRPFPQYDYIATDCCLQNVGHSSYNALVTSLNRQFRNGLNLTVAYTWSKNLTDADSLLPGNVPNGLAQDQDVFNHRLEKSISIQNVPNTFVTSYIYELPFGKGRTYFNKSGVANYVIGGWSVGGVQRYQSGSPISFGCASGIPGYENCIRFSRGPASLASAAYSKNKLHPNVFNGESWYGKDYDPSSQTPPQGTKDLSQAAFVDKNDVNTGFRPLSPECGAPSCSYAPFTLGQGLPRVTEEITTPNWKSEDFSVIKDFPIKDNLAFQLKAEAIDAFNRHNFAIPDGGPRDANFGVPQSGSTTMGPRNLQLTGRITF